MQKNETIGAILREYMQKASDTIPDLMPALTERAQQITRQQQVQDIVDEYVNRYTCGAMADRLAEVEKECKEANLWIEAQCSANNITNEELYTALCKAEQDAKEKGTACVYDIEIKQGGTNGHHELAF